MNSAEKNLHRDQICQNVQNKIPSGDFEKNGMSTKKTQNDHILRINLQEVEGQKKNSYVFKLRGQYQGSASNKNILLLSLLEQCQNIKAQ